MKTLFITLLILWNMDSALAAMENCGAVLDSRYPGQKIWSIDSDRGIANVTKAINAGCDFNQKFKCHRTRHLKNPMPALHCAITGDSDHRKVVEALIEANVDVNAQDENGRTALMYAVEDNDLETIQLLLKKKASLEVLDKAGQKALDYATTNSMNAVTVLLSKESVLFSKQKQDLDFCKYPQNLVSSYFFLAQAMSKRDSTDRKLQIYRDTIQPYASESYYKANCSTVAKQPTVKDGAAAGGR